MLAFHKQKRRDVNTVSKQWHTMAITVIFCHCYVAVDLFWNSRCLANLQTFSVAVLLSVRCELRLTAFEISWMWMAYITRHQNIKPLSCPANSLAHFFLHKHRFGAVRLRGNKDLPLHLRTIYTTCNSPALNKLFK